MDKDKLTEQPHPTLDVAVCTMGNGIERFAATNPPACQGVRWVVSWQKSQSLDVPATLADRPDVAIYRTDSTGLSANRNAAAAHCTADIVLIADDDIIYTADSLTDIRRAFARRTEMDIATFRIAYPDKDCYPRQACRLGYPLPKGYYLTSPELAMRGHIARKYRFNTLLGIGAGDLHGGEEEIFLHTAIQAGVPAWFLPLTIGTHPGATTGTKARLSAANVRAMGCVIAIVTPWTSPLRIPIKAWRISRAGQMALFPALFHLLRGALRAAAVLANNTKL